MKTCPSCGSRYTDDTLSFCLSDGSRLADETSAGEVTVVLGETETVARPRASSGTPAHPSQSVGPPASRTWIAVLLTAAGMLALFVIIAVVGFFVWRNLDTQVATPISENRNGGSTATTPYSSPTQRPTATPSKPTPEPTIARTPEPRANYRSTTRLTMGKGSYSAPFSGEINPGDTRIFVLACRSGQSLSATVSGGPCVTFSGGGTSLSRTTTAGDNSVSVINTCTQITRFSVRISVI